jgi:hypothetical protein
MEDLKQVVTETKPEVQDKKEATKTFTQNELDAIVQDRLTRERNKFAKDLGIDDSFSKENYEEFKKFQEARKTEFDKSQERNQQLEVERETLIQTKTALEHKVLGMELGVKPDVLADALALANLKEGKDMREKMEKVLADYPIFATATQSAQPKNIGSEKKEPRSGDTQAEDWMKRKKIIK